MPPFRITAMTRSVKALLLAALLSCSSGRVDPVGQGEQWSFVVFSDVQQGYGIYSQLARNIGNIVPAPLIAFCCGDIMLRAGNESEWLYFRRYSEPVTDRMSLFLSRGNHEGNSSACEEVLREMWQFPGDHFYYAVRVKDCAFLVTDTQIAGEENSIANEQLEWLKTELEATEGSDAISHVFLFMHQPLFPQGMHHDSPLKNAEGLHELFRGSSKIGAVFSGHDHIFNRYVRDGINYITTGGGGGDLHHGYGGDYHHFVKVSFFSDTPRVNIKTIGVLNEIIEDFDL